MKKILVINANGFQGKAIAQESLKAGYEVRGLVRNLPEEKLEGLEYVIGDLNDEESLSSAFQGIDGVVLQFPMAFDENVLSKYVDNIVKAANKSEVSHIVYNSGSIVLNEQEIYGLRNTAQMIESLLREANLPITFLHPRVYLDNLAAPWSVPMMFAQGILVYPIPGNLPISWISHIDLGRFVVAAFGKPELIGESIEIGGPSITGNEIAEVISEVIGQPVNYIAASPDDFEANISPMFGERLAKGISNIYRHLEANPSTYDFDAKEYEKLGVKPMEFKQWAQNVPWKMLNEIFSK
ncbi:SDR family oxidoreductase [Aureibacter tunicatorum]|uniref:Uncharacterized protein YbjT (DUF2867 family) n=1 Tax=Aureibacter tunicatorum TaxID=866807 RepID=A0AAE3XHW9_9BACT|nr:NmrA family NAD(P)-binding protein [Aureibacter tunicatorum]MDR6238011.1 uncharacterized protein YbjT (DUF2867 family) [Aureibacter tunicatorum]BDD03044.1 hypothetical protein AUTU_05270 [Aureibacter tunicatorum]